MIQGEDHSVFGKVEQRERRKGEKRENRTSNSQRPTSNVQGGKEGRRCGAREFVGVWVCER